MQFRMAHGLLDHLFRLLCASAVWIPIVLLFFLFGKVFIDGLGRLDIAFITNCSSRFPAKAGILPALIGSIYMVLTTAVLAIPIGVGAGIYLEEYAGRSFLYRLIDINISNLSGVPSVIYGLLGVELFVRMLDLGKGILAGSLTMALLSLPMLITTTREALKAVPKHYREACLALGSSKWQTIRQIILPIALPGILTGIVLSVSRIVGETAPLIVVGAATYLTFLPDGFDSEYTVLPIQIFNWVSRPQKAFWVNASAAIVVLLFVLLILNSLAIYLRRRFSVQLVSR